LPKEKEEGAEFVELFDVFPKLKEFEDPLLLFVLFPKLKDEGELVFPPKFPKVVVVEFELLGVPNDEVEGVEKDPNVDPVFAPNIEGVEVDDCPKEKADGVLVFDFAPKEKGEELLLLLLFVVFEPKPLVFDELPPKEKAEGVDELEVD
jgi:hypothetical protein